MQIKISISLYLKVLLAEKTKEHRKHSERITMHYLKYCIVFVALIATTIAMSSTWGKRNSTDILLLNETVLRTPVANTYLQADVVFPKSGQTNTRNITAIFVYDRFTNTSGATPNLWSGGPGFKFATVNLKSQYGKGINSTVEIWGK